MAPRLPSGRTWGLLEDLASVRARSGPRYDLQFASRRYERRVQYRKFWVDEADGKVFCLVEAPDAETAATVHREAHGLVADKIYLVREG